MSRGKNRQLIPHIKVVPTEVAIHGPLSNVAGNTVGPGIITQVAVPTLDDAISKMRDDDQIRWWFEDQTEVNWLVVRAIEGDTDAKRSLKAVVEFMRNGWTCLGPKVPISRFLPRSTSSGVVMEVPLSEYPTIVKSLEFFTGGPVMGCDPKDAQLIAYTARNNTWGIRTGEMVVADAQRPWNFTRGGMTEFDGVVLYYKAV